MFFIKAAVLVDAFRFDPDTELHAEGVDSLNEVTERFAQLLLVDKPVAQSAEIVVSVSEPAVVHDNHVDAQLFGVHGELIDRLAIKIKVSAFPAVYQDWADSVFIFPSAHMIPDADVEILGKTV